MAAADTSSVARGACAARVVMAPARPEDEPGIRRLLRESPFAGAVSLSLEREPDFHAAAAVEGDRHDVVVGRDPEGGIVGLATRSVRTAFVNGAPARLGYLGQLRAAGAGRGNVRAIRDGFALLRAARRPGETPFDLTSIVSDNLPARRLLEAGLPGYPTYRPLGGMVTLALVARAAHRRRLAGGLAVAAANEPGDTRLAEVTALLQADGPRRQFCPCLSTADLAGGGMLRGLARGDWLVVERAGRPAACAAVWDQRAFKQVVVRGYAPALSALRPIISILGPLGAALGFPRLPPVGAPLDVAFLAFTSVDPSEPDPAAALDALLDAALERAAARGLGTLLLGLAEDHPLLATARRRPHRPYRSTLYAVHFEDGAATAAALDGRTLGPEVATL